jgi:hypothetical protein
MSLIDPLRRRLENQGEGNFAGRSPSVALAFLEEALEEIDAIARETLDAAGLGMRRASRFEVDLSERAAKIVRKSSRREADAGEARLYQDLLLEFRLLDRDSRVSQS